ncbi:MAG: site-specific integrase [Egibacteraceae bacterium]
MHPRYAPPVTLAAGCGLRQGEAFGLRVSDVDFLRQRLEVRQQVKHPKGQGTVVAPPKRGKQRSVPLPAAVAEAIAGHLARYPTERDGLVVTSAAGTPLNRGSWNARVWKPAVAAAGLETGGLGFHQLRHHYASVLLHGGVSIRALAEYLGHDDPGFTLRVYSHVMPDSEDRARQAVDAALTVCEPPVSQEQEP